MGISKSEWKQIKQNGFEWSLLYLKVICVISWIIVSDSQYFKLATCMMDICVVGHQTEIITPSRGLMSHIWRTTPAGDMRISSTHRIKQTEIKASYSV